MFSRKIETGLYDRLQYLMLQNLTKIQKYRAIYQDMTIELDSETHEICISVNPGNTLFLSKDSVEIMEYVADKLKKEAKEAIDRFNKSYTTVTEWNRECTVIVTSLSTLNIEFIVTVKDVYEVYDWLKGRKWKKLSC